MDEEARELERRIRRDPALSDELATIRETIQDLDVPGQEQAVERARQALDRARRSGNADEITVAEITLRTEERILRERRKAVQSLIGASSSEIQGLWRSLERRGLGVTFLSLISIFTDAGIGVIDAINNHDSLLGPIYRATLQGNCQRAIALIQKKTLNQHALDLRPITGASAIATEEILEWIFSLVREACAKMREERDDE